MSRLPLDVVYIILEEYVVAYIEDLFGPSSSSLRAGHDNYEQLGSVRAVLPLLLTSRQFRETTLRSLSQLLSVPLDPSGERFETRPWPHAFDVQAAVANHSEPDTLLTELESVTAAPPVLALCIFAKAALREIQRRRRGEMCHVSAWTINADAGWLHDRFRWERAVRDACTACDGPFLARSTAQTVLWRCARDTLAKALIALRYSFLAVDVMQSIRILHRDYAQEGIAHHEFYSLLAVENLLMTLRHTKEEVFNDRKDELYTAPVMPDRDDINDACILMQRVMDTEFTESPMLTECKTLARTLKDEWDQRLSQMSGAGQPAMVGAE